MEDMSFSFRDDIANGLLRIDLAGTSELTSDTALVLLNFHAVSNSGNTVNTLIYVTGMGRIVKVD
jgi:hypothetical protein